MAEQSSFGLSVPRYVSQYVQTPTKEIVGAVSELRKRYDNSQNNRLNTLMLAKNIKVGEGDAYIKQKALTDFESQLENFAKEGNWEDAELAVQDATVNLATNQSLQNAQASYGNYLKELEFINKVKQEKGSGAILPFNKDKFKNWNTEQQGVYQPAAEYAQDWQKGMMDLLSRVEVDGFSSLPKFLDIKGLSQGEQTVVSGLMSNKTLSNRQKLDEIVKSGIARKLFENTSEGKQFKAAYEAGFAGQQFGKTYEEAVNNFARNTAELFKKSSIDRNYQMFDNKNKEGNGEEDFFSNSQPVVGNRFSRKVEDVLEQANIHYNPHYKSLYSGKSGDPSNPTLPPNALKPLIGSNEGNTNLNNSKNSKNGITNLFEKRLKELYPNFSLEQALEAEKTRLNKNAAFIGVMPASKSASKTVEQIKAIKEMYFSKDVALNTGVKFRDATGKPLDYNEIMNLVKGDNSDDKFKNIRLSGFIKNPYDENFDLNTAAFTLTNTDGVEVQVLAEPLPQQKTGKRWLFNQLNVARQNGLGGIKMTEYYENGRKYNVLLDGVSQKPVHIYDEEGNPYKQSSVNKLWSSWTGE